MMSERAGPVAEREPDRRGPDRAHVELALTADVPGPHPEGERGAQAGEEQRGGVDESRREGAVGGDGGRVHLVVGRERVVTRGQQQDADDDGGDDEGRQRHGDLEPPRRVQPAFDAAVGPGHLPPPPS